MRSEMTLGAFGKGLQMLKVGRSLAENEEGLGGRRRLVQASRIDQKGMTGL